MKKVLYLLYKIKIWLLSRYYIAFPSKGTYAGLYRYKDVFGSKRYVQIRNRIFARVTNRIRGKKNKSIRIIMAFCSEWCATDIYQYFEKRGVDIAVVLSPYFNGTQENVKKEYARNREFCIEKGFRYIDAFDVADWSLQTDIKDIRGDVIIYVKPWMAHYAKQVSLYNMPLSSISCYIPYGFMLAKGESFQFNQKCHNMFTHIFCESKSHHQLYGKYCDIGNSHVEFSGHPKMDPFVEEKAIDEQKIWKGTAGNAEMLKVIYSPHWWFSLGYATFADNALSILEYAETHTDTTSWIYKPHPHLEQEVVAGGYMSREQYQAYVDRWKNLPNANVYQMGDYTDIFVTSDCIVNDSISFIVEYMYTHKPMLLLQNADVEYNEFGQQAADKVYTCKGSDIDGIFNFLENVRNGMDEMKDARERFFDENLNYCKIRGQKAGAYISRRISDMIEA